MSFTKADGSGATKTLVDITPHAGGSYASGWSGGSGLGVGPHGGFLGAFAEANWTCRLGPDGGYDYGFCRRAYHKSSFDFDGRPRPLSDAPLNGTQFAGMSGDDV